MLIETNDLVTVTWIGKHTGLQNHQIHSRMRKANISPIMICDRDFYYKKDAEDLINHKLRDGYHAPLK